MAKKPVECRFKNRRCQRRIVRAQPFRGYRTAGKYVSYYHREQDDQHGTKLFFV